LSLGITQSRARRLLPHFNRTRNGFDNFCLRPTYGIRAGYPSRLLLREVSRRQRDRIRGRVVILLTGNRHYTLDGVRPGVRRTAAARRLKLGRPLHVGLNYWYIVPGRSAAGIIKVRRGTIGEVGIVNRSVVQGRAAQYRFLRSFGSGESTI
jgi:hypothetical protein